jgi:isocitrate dehydrogenase
MTANTPITVAYGNGIGPEIMQSTLKILAAAEAKIELEVIEIGEKIYLQGHTSGINEATWQSLKRTKVLLKGPITTPQGGGYKSLNVTLRKTLGLFANVRPCTAYAPYVKTHYPDMDLVIIRENEEDAYSGIEYRGTEDTYQCLKLISRPGCERIIRYAFEYARKFNRKKVTCFSKDNIMKMTDGLFHRVFDEIAAHYPDIIHEHFIIDIGTALLATQPERFDVIVTLNLYGDIISDVAAQVAGSVGLAGSANIGHRMAMFEAIHGSAPDIANKNIANPSGLLHGAIQMLTHINQLTVASAIENAWLVTLEDGIHTADIYSPAHSKQKASTETFTNAIIERLGKKPIHFKPITYESGMHNTMEHHDHRSNVSIKKELVGVDIFIDNVKNTPAVKLAEKIAPLSKKMPLIVITSRGLKIWPDSTVETSDLRHCCCRFQSAKHTENLTLIQHEDIIQLLQQFSSANLDVTQTENLYLFNGEPGFTLAQGQ